MTIATARATTAVAAADATTTTATTATVTAINNLSFTLIMSCLVLFYIHFTQGMDTLTQD